VRSRAKVTIDGLQEVVYEKSIMRNRLVPKRMTLTEVVSKSYQPLCYIRRWISRKPLEIEVEIRM